MEQQANNDFWISHSCGAWMMGHGSEIGSTVLKTSAMGISECVRRPLHTGPRDIVERLVAANSAQLGPPNAKVTGAA